MSLRQFVDEGWLREVNRQFFHPRGLALAATYKNDAPDEPVLLGPINMTDDVEGWEFGDTLDPAKRVIPANAHARHAKARIKLLGNTVEGEAPTWPQRRDAEEGELTSKLRAHVGKIVYISRDDLVAVEGDLCVPFKGSVLGADGTKTEVEIGARLFRCASERLEITEQNVDPQQTLAERAAQNLRDREDELYENFQSAMQDVGLKWENATLYILDREHYFSDQEANIIWSQWYWVGALVVPPAQVKSGTG